MTTKNENPFTLEKLTEYLRTKAPGRYDSVDTEQCLLAHYTRDMGGELVSTANRRVSYYKIGEYTISGTGQDLFESDLWKVADGDSGSVVHSLSVIHSFKAALERAEKLLVEKSQQVD